MTNCKGRTALVSILATCVAALAAPPSALAQSAGADTAGSPSATPSDQAVQMSAFEVTTTQGHGYVATNADAGFKTVQPLIDIPQDIEVVTRDMIDDIGATDTTRMLQYFGSGGVSFLGEATAMRGYTSKYPYTDDQPANMSFEDNFYVDTYVVVRGDAQVLYLNANPTGVILKYTKKPLPYQQTIVDASVNSLGGTRILLDTTGPIGTFGDVKLSYRFDALQQGPENYFYNVHESHEGLYPAFQMVVNNIMTVRFFTIFTSLMHYPNPGGLIQPDGKLYLGAGPREINIPPNDMEHHEQHRYHVDIDTKASENWDFRFAASYWHFHEFAPIIQENSYNWAAQTQNWISRLNDISIDYWALIGDLTGKYNFGPLSQQDNAGFGYNDKLTHQYLPPTPDFVNGAINLPLNDVEGVNALRVPAVSEYPALGAPGATPALHNQSYVTSIYYQHTMDIVPKYLTGVFGWTWATVSNDSAPNVATIPYQASVVAAAQWIHRFGLVFHPVKEVSIYALTATGFAPPSGAAPILYDGTQAPPQSYEGNEVGFKTNFFNGKISTTFAVFKISETNLLAVGPGTSVITGSGYYIPIGAGVGEGYDGDIELFLTPNWQLIAYAYAGHWNDQNGRPLPSSYDNSWSLFTRYVFPSDSPLKRLAVGGGAKQVGGGFVSASNIFGYTFAPVPSGSTQVIKIQKGFEAQVFASYDFTKNLLARLSCTNLTDEHYPLGFDGSPVLVDPSHPRVFSLELDYKY